MLTHRRRKEIASLSKRKYRQRLGQFLIEGVRSVASAVDAGAPIVDMLVAADAPDDVRALARRSGAPVHEVEPDELARLGDAQTSQGILAVAETRLASLDALTQHPRIVVLDAVQDPGNAGTILRTAAWFGADALLAGPGTADLFNPKTVRSAMGGLWDLALATTDDLASALDALRIAGHALYGADMEGTALEAWHPAAPSALLMGSEAHGLSHASRERLTERVTIPAAPGRAGTESLNVAVAAGILLHAWVR